MYKDILVQIGSSAFVIASAAYIAKTWIKHELDRVAAKNSHELAKQIAKLNVHEPHLHRRRVEIIEAIYEKMLVAELNLQSFLVTWWAHSNKEEVRMVGLSVQGEFSNEIGLEFCKVYTEINAMLHKNSLYFDDQFIKSIREAYNPFFDMILNMRESDPPKFPEELKDIVSKGKEPRQSIVSLFRGVLGVEKNSHDR